MRHIFEWMASVFPAVKPDPVGEKALDNALTVFESRAAALVAVASQPSINDAIESLSKKVANK